MSIESLDGHTFVPPPTSIQRFPLSGESAHDRGDKSEKNVIAVLAHLPFVKQVFPTVKNGREDHRGCDAFVRISPAPQEIKQIRVEVKSSARGIRNFKKNIAGKFKLPLRSVDDWLIAKHHIVLNGQQTPLEIATDFTRGIQEITNVIYRFDPQLLEGPAGGTEQFPT